MVVGQLLDDECPEDFIKGLILSVRSLLPVEPLVAECEKRYRALYLIMLLETISFFQQIPPLTSYVKQESPTTAHTIFGTSCQ